MRAFVYFNLHRKVFSIKALEGPQRGRVIAHSATVALSNVTFKVSEAGRQRVLREKRKNVHAGVVGDYDPLVYGNSAEWRGEAVSYNPYKAPTFVKRPSGEPVHTASFAFITTTMGVLAQDAA
jgi:hypothetical protein